MLNIDKYKQEENYLLASQVISFCLLAILILVAVGFKDSLLNKVGYYRSTIMFLVILTVIVLLRLQSIQQKSVRFEYLSHIFYYIITAIFLAEINSNSYEILLIMPVIIMALRYGKKHAMGTVICSLVVLFYISFKRGFTTIDSYIMYAILFTLVAWLLGNLRETEKNIRTKLERLASNDGLTDLYNHRSFQSIMDIELDKAEKRKTLVSIIMLDIDYFKVYNDSFGHQKGDQVLKLVAEVLRESTPEGCFCARYGGEEFALILPGKNLEETRNLGER